MDSIEQGKDAGPKYYDLALPHADYPEWIGLPQRSLLICTQQRSGSTLLGEAIYFAGGLGCPLEYFHAGFRPGFESRWRAHDIQAYMNMVHRFRTDSTGIFAVKLFWWDVVELLHELAPREFDWLSRATPPRLDASLYRRMRATIAGLFPSPTFVFLSRRDEIAQAVSQSIAAQTRTWRQFSKQGAARQAPYDFDGIVHRLAEIQNENRHWLNFFRANSLSSYDVTYEDLANDYETTVRRLFVYLGRPDAKIVPPRLRKQARARSEEFVRRFLADFHRRARG